MFVNCIQGVANGTILDNIHTIVYTLKVKLSEFFFQKNYAIGLFDLKSE